MDLVKDPEVDSDKLDRYLTDLATKLESTEEEANAPSTRYWTENDLESVHSRVIDFDPDTRGLIVTMAELKKVHRTARKELSHSPSRPTDTLQAQISGSSPDHGRFHDDPQLGPMKRRKLAQSLDGFVSQIHDSGVCITQSSSDDIQDQFDQLQNKTGGSLIPELINHLQSGIDHSGVPWTAHEGNSQSVLPQASALQRLQSLSASDVFHADSIPIFANFPMADLDAPIPSNVPATLKMDSWTSTPFTPTIFRCSGVPCDNMSLSPDRDQNISGPESATGSGLLSSKSPTRVQEPTPKLSTGHFNPTDSNYLSFKHFLLVRGKMSTVDETLPITPTSQQTQQELENVPRVPSRLKGTPEELFDSLTIRFSDNRFPNHVHRYMASIDTLQRRGLINSFKSRKCLIDLVERNSLGGAHLILDPDTAVFFNNLAALPIRREAVTKMLSQLSWHFSKLLIVLEAYPESWGHRRDQPEGGACLHAYSPATIKAVRGLRRDLSIAEAFETKSVECTIYFGFANTVDEAAMLTRTFGDFAESTDETSGAIWGERQWLNLDEQDVFL